MAQTAGVINGTLLLVQVGGVTIAAAQSHSFSTSIGARDTTNKDNAGYKTIMPGLREWSISGNGMFTFDGTYTYDDLFALYTNRTSVTLKFGSVSNAGDLYWSGTAYLTELSVDAPSEENATYSYTFTGSGAITQYTTT